MPAHPPSSKGTPLPNTDSSTGLGRTHATGGLRPPGQLPQIRFESRGFFVAKILNDDRFMFGAHDGRGNETATSLICFVTDARHLIGH
ncbi:MAG: hypothetical protein CEO12_354 [Parcubacteria group bacterium Gr01-1014_46]|nr:MAG: hypothetical protein CEO12_354 [Parcubacteria group bacterium Gr01-1014_46]